jgi:hypothetical protein
LMFLIKMVSSIYHMQRWILFNDSFTTVQVNIHKLRI